jgi:hypothetical protein
MKNRLIIFLIGFLLLSSGVVFAQEDTQPNVTDEVINQNIKDRLKKVASEQDSLVGTKQKRAVIGQLESLANDTLTIKTKDQIKLASVSAETEYVRNPGGQTVEVEDLAIGDYVIAMGYINGSEVLEARRVLLYSDAPEAVTKKSFFGTITNIDSDEEVLTLISPFSEEISVLVDTTSDFLIPGQNGNDEITFEDLTTGQMVLVIYQPNNQEELELLTLLALPNQQPEEEEEVATESANLPQETVPPELGF